MPPLLTHHIVATAHVLTSRLAVRKLPSGNSLTVDVYVASHCEPEELAFVAGNYEKDECDRPTRATLFLCRSLFEAENPRKVILHEFVHILAFTPEMIPFFRFTNGWPRVIRDPLTTSPMLNLRCGNFLDLQSIPGVLGIICGSNRCTVVLTTENVRNASEKHLKFPGGPLSQAAHELNCVSGHWAEGISESIADELTIGLLKDSGWYELV
jgi:hypothetical protein